MLLLALLMTAAAPPPDSDGAPSAQMQALIQNCDAHKFETFIDVTVDGKPKKSRVRLCGTEGQSDADWVRTLKDAVVKTESNLGMPASARDQIVAALNAEIARLGAGGSGLAALPPPRRATTIADEGYSTLPAMPPPRESAPAAPLPEYSALPPLPTAPTAPTRVLPLGAATAMPALPRPRMTFSCLTPGDVGEGPCTGFTRDTLLIVKADEDLPAGTSIRFVRNGEPRGDIALVALKRGRSTRFPLPPQLCSHVVGGTIEMRIVRSVPGIDPSGEEVGKDGPYDLRC